jgi:urea transporter
MDVDHQPLRPTRTGLVNMGNSSFQYGICFIDTVLRGIGQVMLQNNSLTGLIFLIGIFYNSILFGLATLIGACVSTATAVFLGIDRQYQPIAENPPIPCARITGYFV